METFLLWLIIGVAAFFCVRSLYRTMTGKSKGCSCDTSCDACPPDITPIDNINRLPTDKRKDPQEKNN